MFSARNKICVLLKDCLAEKSSPEDFLPLLTDDRKVKLFAGDLLVSLEGKDELDYLHDVFVRKFNQNESYILSVLKKDLYFLNDQHTVFCA